MKTGVSPVPMKDRILEAADRLFYGQGIQAVGVDAVANEAGISKRTLYKHYPSKDELVAAYLSRRTGQAITAEGTPVQQILGLFDGLEKWFGNQRFRGCAFVNAVAELSGERQHPAVAVASGHKARRLAQVVELLRELAVDGPERLAEQIVVLFEGAVAVSMVRGGDPQVAVSAREAATVLLRNAGVAVDREPDRDGRDLAR
ncbi:TetR/AcrR family transcriptional regulator [Piscinibacter gummiphilus]|uniref:TetR/AcrR family transcriptional regulator n=1 Tax=Piscinibacter gummiphilus TaxID=946333 RepID=A0ABZ0CRW6_9BURK|nr:TetR/AcrR family transcriptional regulator [Piscinibacter gummiphilus]WOB07732.1 TetR/AcrR family transcriptional regulator [Piscinibacter gummiphilus]